MDARLYFHSPCFDGVVSAILASDFLKNELRWSSIQLVSVNYHLRETWLRTALEKPVAVVDFLYHPDATFWADPHSTSFLTNSVQSDYGRRAGKWMHVYDATSKSCAGLLWRHLQQRFNYRKARFAELVKWADRIDSAEYQSVEEAVTGQASALVINRCLSGKGAKEFSEDLVWKLIESPLESVARLPEVLERHRELQQLSDAGLERLSDAIHLVGDIAVFDVNSTGVSVNRYAPFKFHPTARYSAGIVRREHSVTITAMRNPWMEFPSVSLGKYFEGIGGGGHQRVGSVVLRGDDVQRAEGLLENVQKYILNKCVAINARHMTHD